MSNVRHLSVTIRITGDTGIPDRVVVDRINALLQGSDRVRTALADAGSTRVDSVEYIHAQNTERAMLDLFSDTKNFRLEMAVPPSDVATFDGTGPVLTVAAVPAGQVHALVLLGMEPDTEVPAPKKTKPKKR